MFHGGDSDSTGVMAACWFGVMYGVDGVPKSNYKVRKFLLMRLHTIIELLNDNHCYKSGI